MPQFMVTSPDGRKFRVNAPEGATQQDAIAYIQRQQMQQAPALSGEDTQFLKDQGLTEEEIQAQARIRSQSPGQGVIPEQRAPGISPRQPGGFRPDPSVAAIEAEADAQPRTLGGQLARDVPRTARGMAQGASFGTSDEALAGLRSLGGENYGQALADERAELGKLGPARLPAEIVGSLPLGLAAGGRVAAAKTLGGRVGQGALMGGGMGAAYGFGSGEGGLGNRLENALLAGGTGAVVGAGLPLGAAVASKAGGAIRDRLVSALAGNKGVNTVGQRKVIEAAMEQFPGLSPEQAVARAQRRSSRYGDDAALIDAGPRFNQLGADTARQGGAPATELEDFLINRQMGTGAFSGRVRGGQADRLNAALDEAAGGKASGLSAQRSLRAQQKAASDPLYKQTANNPSNVVDNEAFARARTNPITDELLGKMKGDKKNFVEFGGERIAMSDLPDNSLPVIDELQKKLSDKAGKLLRKGAKNEAGKYIKARRELLEAADEAFPDYNKAREVWRDFQGVADADDLGRKFMRGDVDVLEDAVKRMTPEELEQFRAGAVASLKDVVSKTPFVRDASNKLLNTPNVRNRTRIAFGSPQVYRRYLKKAVGENEKFKALAELAGNSKTAERLARMEKTSVDPAEIVGTVADVATGNKVGMALRLGRALRSRSGPPESARREIIRILMDKNFTPIKGVSGSAQVYDAGKRALLRALMTGESQRTREVSRPTR